jgi:hypothetical protein
MDALDFLTVIVVALAVIVFVLARNAAMVLGQDGTKAGGAIPQASRVPPLAKNRATPLSANAGPSVFIEEIRHLILPGAEAQSNFNRGRPPPKARP